ncbi:MAG: AzlD domain-containing protein [Firmicutes bacterium]|nr:AzlD domain-containing protein [Bacillota bacterium]MBQ3200267.1 AzlD domain-containing protein [Bacillota bacterium]
MPTNAQILLYVLVMAGVTYLIRLLPLVCFRKKITNVFVQSFLYYVPYAVLGAMTVPAIFSSTGYLASAVCGLLAAIFFAYKEKSLLYVAVAASAVVFVAERVIEFFV